MPEESSSGFQQQMVYQPAPPPSQRPRLELRPLSTGEILDRVFFLYRSRWSLFIGITLVAAAVKSLDGAVALAMFRTRYHAYTTAILLILRIVAGLLAFLVTSVTQAATTSAVSNIYLGRDTSIGASFRAVIGKWYRYILIALWQGWAAFWPFILLLVVAGAAMGAKIVWLYLLLFFLALASLAYGIVSYIRNSLAVSATVVESLPVRAAMRRSKNLVDGRAGRIFLMFLLIVALYLVFGMLQAPASSVIGRAPLAPHPVAQGVTLAITFLSVALLLPVGCIGLCLFYFDERVRREGFDIEFMMAQSDVAEPVNQ